MSLKRRILGALGKAELLELGRRFELEVTQRMTLDELLDAVASSKKAKVERIVTEELARDTLKAMCEGAGLDPHGKEKQVLIDRLLAAMGKGDKPDGKTDGKTDGKRGTTGDAASAKAETQVPLAIPAVDETRVAAARADMTTPRAEGKPRKRSGTAVGGIEGTGVVSYRHADRRRNNPEVGMVDPDTDPVQPKTQWAHDPHLDPALQFDVGRAGVERLIDDALASGDEAVMKQALEHLKRQAQPYLNWAGKAERTSFEVDTVSLHVHERIDPASILAAVRRGQRARKAGNDAAGDKASQAAPLTQLGLFSAPFENLPLRDAIDFYKHDRGWSNRLIAGDSLLVMNSLLHKEGMAGQVQMIYIDPPYGIRYGSNFQPFVNKRDVKDGKDEDLTQEPEMIKAFRDTWELGIHSYLTYLRDRLLTAHALLADTGSIFVQISDENLHTVRMLLDETFGTTNFVSLVTFIKTSGQTSERLAGVSDYLLWYAKNAEQIKYRPLFNDKTSNISGEYVWLRENDGKERTLNANERVALDAVDGRVFRHDSMVSQGYRQFTTVEVPFVGKIHFPGNNNNWKTTVDGIRRLGRASRLLSSGRILKYKRFVEDFPVLPIANSWTDTATGGSSADPRVYVVQTVSRVIERCMLMTTDPGDLVLDPTCGSGTTAVVAEKWGRRWITCDTSRVAITLAKQRLATTSYDYFDLKYPHEGLKGGFIYKTVPHVMLSSIANNPEIDEIYEKYHPDIDTTLAKLNAALRAKPPAPFEVNEGGRKGETIDFTIAASKTVKLPSGESAPAGAVLEWEVPFDFPADWASDARLAFDAFHAARQTMQQAMDQSIAAHADQEVLYDQPKVAKDKLRITGPFTVEAVPFPSVYSLDDTQPAAEADVAIARSGESSRQHQWRDELLKTGIRGKGGQQLKLASIEPMPGLRYVHGVGNLADSGERVAVSFGPEHGALEQNQVEMAMREAGELFPRPKMIIYCAFAFDPEAAKDIDQTKGITALKAQMNTDLLTDDLKKGRASNQSFWLMGQPEVEIHALANGLYKVEVHGFDYFDTAKGELVSGGKSRIAMWSLDTDYDERSLFPRQVFFPMAGAKDGWHRLKKDLRAELDEGLMAQFHGTVSLPFAPGEHRKIAVKLVDDRGIESLKVVRLD